MTSEKPINWDSVVMGDPYNDAEAARVLAELPEVPEDPDDILTTTSIRLRPSQRKALQAEAASRQTDVSSIIRELIDLHLAVAPSNAVVRLADVMRALDSLPRQAVA